MKRVYTESYLTRNPKALLSRASAFIVRNRRKLLAGFVLLLLLMFVISCLLVVSDARLYPVVAETTRKFNGPQGPKPTAPWVYANAAVLIDGESGRVLYDKNAHQPLPVASTTKMMTALVVRQQLELNEKVVISPEAAQVGEQEIWLEPGETLTVEELLWALLVQSANDAAYALAQHTTGSAESFVRLMNEEARKIGAVESHFTNPHGLDEPEHYSTAYDLAIIARQLLKDPVLAKMVVAKTHDIPWPAHPYPRTAVNHNELLKQYPGATGVKTGYTIPAGYCLVGSATKEGKQLVAVALNSQHRASDVGSLFDYGFQGTERVVLVRKGETLGRARTSAFPRRFVRLVAEKEDAALSLKGSGDVFRRKDLLPRGAPGKIRKGGPIGLIECWLNENPIYRQRAKVAGNASKPGVFAAVLVFIWYAFCWMGRILSAPFRIW